MSNLLPGVDQHHTSSYKPGDSLQIYSEIREIYSVRKITTTNREEYLAITVVGQTGGSGWTFIHSPSGFIPGIKKTDAPFKEGTVILFESGTAYVRQTDSQGGGWTYKHGLSTANDKAMRRYIDEKTAKVIHDPADTLGEF